MKSGTPLGVRVKAVVEAGHLVDDETICACLEAELVRLEASGNSQISGVLLDGLPRNVAQVGLLDQTMTRLKATVSCVLNFEVDLDELRERFAHRYVCALCHKVGSFKTNPADVPGEFCDKADSVGGRPGPHKWIRRPDDEPSVVDRRLKIYADETRPVAAIYEKLSLLNHVPGLGTPEVVYSRVSHAVVERLGLT
jgi:adenylate kinase